MKIALVALPLLLMGLVGEIYFRLLPEPAYVSPEVARERSLQYVPVLFARHALAQQPRQRRD